MTFRLDGGSHLHLLADGVCQLAEVEVGGVDVLPQQHFEGVEIGGKRIKKLKLHIERTPTRLRLRLLFVLLVVVIVLLTGLCVTPKSIRK